jgi:spermidine/putrescine transport system ATP-binding protein
VTEYVADFLGVSNLISGQSSGSRGDGGCQVRVGEFDLVAGRGSVESTGLVRLVIRPERVRVEAYGSTGGNRVPGMVERLVYLGATTQLVVRLAHGETVQAMIAHQGRTTPYRQGEPGCVHLPEDSLRVIGTG